MTFIKKPLVKLIILTIILAVFLWGAWYFWLDELLKRERTFSIVSEWTLSGYEFNVIDISEEETVVSYKPKEHTDEHIQRVIDNVNVQIKTYPTPEEAQKQIKNASLVYIWEWRKTKILDHQFEVSTGFLFSPEERRYKESYLAWIENETTYYELIARSADIRDYSDKEYLFKSAQEVAEAILTER